MRDGTQILGLATAADAAKVCEAIEELTPRVADLVEQVTAPSANVVGTPDWPLAELAAHVASVPSAYADWNDRGVGRWASSPDDMERASIEARSHLHGASMVECGAALRHGGELLVQLIRGHEPTDRIPFHCGTTVTAAELGGAAIGELLIHGRDLARTLGRPWSVTADHAVLVLAGYLSALPEFVAPLASGHTATYEIRLRDTRGFMRWRFEDGALDTRWSAPTPNDTVLVADPATLLLVFMGRVSQWSAIARGRILSFGRRPWLALSLTSRLQTP